MWSCQSSSSWSSPARCNSRVEETPSATTKRPRDRLSTRLYPSSPPIPDNLPGTISTSFSRLFFIGFRDLDLDPTASAPMGSQSSRRKRSSLGVFARYSQDSILVRYLMLLRPWWQRMRRGRLRWPQKVKPNFLETILLKFLDNMKKKESRQSLRKLLMTKIKI